MLRIVAEIYGIPAAVVNENLRQNPLRIQRVERFPNRSSGETPAGSDCCCSGRKPATAANLPTGDNILV